MTHINNRKTARVVIFCVVWVAALLHILHARPSYASSPTDDTRIRLSTAIAGSKASKEFRSQAQAILRSETYPFDVKSFQSMFFGGKPPNDAVEKRLAIYVWLYGLRNEPEKVAQIYLLLPAEWRGTVLASSTYYHSYIGPKYEVVGIVALRDWAVQAINSKPGSTATSAALTQILKYLKNCRSETTVSDIGALLKVEVANLDVYRRIVLAACQIFDKDFKEPATWYYQWYAATPDDIEFFQGYFNKYLTSIEINSLVVPKEQKLHEDAALVTEYLLK